MPYDVEYTDEFETWWNRLTVRQQEDGRLVVRLLEERGTCPAGARMGTMKYRPLSELTKDWPPERVASSEAKGKKMLADLDRRDRARPRDEPTSPAPPVELRAGRRN